MDSESKIGDKTVHDIRESKKLLFSLNCLWQSG